MKLCYFSKGQNHSKLVLKYKPFRSLKNSQVGQVQSAVYSIFLLGPAFAFSCTAMVMEIVHDREVSLPGSCSITGLRVYSSYFPCFTDKGKKPSEGEWSNFHIVLPVNHGYVRHGVSRPCCVAADYDFRI